MSTHICNWGIICSHINCIPFIWSFILSPKSVTKADFLCRFPDHRCKMANRLWRIVAFESIEIVMFDFIVPVLWSIACSILEIRWAPSLIQIFSVISRSSLTRMAKEFVLEHILWISLSCIIQLVVQNEWWASMHFSQLIMPL